MPTEEPWPISLRAQALAKLLLTEREDFEVIENLSHGDYDFLVRVRASETVASPEFAVEVKGTRGRLSVSTFKSWLERVPSAKTVRNLPFCLFVFDVDSREGKFCWVQEPAVSSEGEPTLRATWKELLSSRVAPDYSSEAIPSPPFTQLNSETLEQITLSVVAWTKSSALAFRKQAQAS